MTVEGVSEADWTAAETVWNYQQLNHELRPTSAAIGLGSHDLRVAAFAADLYHRGLFPVLVFSGGNSPATLARFPRGEATHFRERAIELGVPSEAILVESRATNTGENITLSRRVLEDAGVAVDSVMLISMPGMQRRAYATCRKAWPDVDVICASEPINLHTYIESFGDPRLVIDDLVGDLQRVMEYPRLGFAISQEVPNEVQAAYRQLVRSGFTSRVLSA